MTIVDTTVWVDYINGVQNPETDWLHRKFDTRALALTNLILCEVLQGIRRDAAYRKAVGLFSSFNVLNCVTEATAIASAGNYRRLRGQGFTVRKTIDCIIATFCIMNGHSLLHRDRDFDPFENHLGLRVIHPESVPPRRHLQ